MVFSKFLSTSLALSGLGLLTQQASADTETHPIVVQKLIENSGASTVLVKIAKQYNYDEGVTVKDVTQKLIYATADSKDVTVLQVGIPEKAFPSESSESEENPEGGDSEENPDSEDNPEAAGGEGEGDSEDPLDKTIDWKVKEKKETEHAKGLIEKLSIEKEKMPYLAVFRHGKEISSLKLTDKNWDDVKTWAEGQSLTLTDPIQSSPAIPPEFQLALDQVAEAIKAKDDSKLKKALAEAKKTIAADAEDEDLGPSDSKAGLRRKMFAATLEKVAGKGVKGAMEYAEKEIKRVSGLLISPAIGTEKKNEMRHKVTCLKTLSQKVNAVTDETAERAEM